MSLERHELLEKDVGAYVLGALGETETARFEQHLEECHICRDEVEQLRVAADALPRSVVPFAPPESLKRSLMETVRAEAAELATERGSASARVGDRRWGWARRLVAGSGAARRGPRPALAWVSAAFILVVGVLAGYAGTHVLSNDDETQTLSAAVDRERLPAGSGSLLVRDDRGEGAILRVHGMPALSKGGVYQVWVMRGDEVVPGPLFSVGANGAGAAAVEGDLDGADAVAVTRETAGGARSPSEDPVLTVKL